MSEKRNADTGVAGLTMAGWQWDGNPDRAVLLLHAGVCDSRSWSEVAVELTDLAVVTAYDRPGFGDTPSGGVRDHVADAVAVLRAHADRPAWLVGSSLGGAVALDVALSAPELVAGLVLIAPAVTGSPEPERAEAEHRLRELLGAAEEAGDLDEVNRFETWYWLDGPTQPEGRVTGPARVLALEMNRTILDNADQQGGEGDFDESVDAWSRLGEIAVPTTVAVGEFDQRPALSTARHLQSAIPGARYVELTGTAHLPYLDAPDQVVSLIRTAIAR
jgi:pimeloyl-ACP methyl ester carboxylesterase